MELVRTRGSGTQTVYATIRQEILAMTLAPGCPLDEVKLSERFGMSRTPIREALLRLSADGLITTLPNRSTIVAAIDFATLPTYFEALTLMYRVTTRGAADKRNSTAMAHIRACQADFAQAVASRDAYAMIEANRDFHVAIAELAGNHYYTTFFSRLLDEGRRILRLYYSTFDDRLPRQYVDEHEETIATIEAQDVEKADALATGHADQIVAQIQKYVARDAGNARRITIV
ncbi:GntR family transcriptional regulator [Rhizobium sp. VS19-DR104.2]|uniref:GntR family transcriptional regulator n=1 Tax=unclassified Rhizobium TaxID=2613769 RepID=UPI001C5B96EC|nr:MULTISPECIES: GntR family transcriptional regulator [unclassified Rhizobium]MBZ5762047.1 GntR family transcriptional regulator [Rhizobium sp. VS19-DR96]MBZ5768160.1 GntR family transcriptional regulator [Rhizobium sp. VS19-DR129.2]MBZ5775774.1 GntR family transcriptional regulator [Rhizobium sp. VS19-DRK62.2]MBZ5786925.1 GntR family transcriptional regulator [Rhizobium sp. VS19-DR121]MBZ5804086.1 GntR family transcriptional regulator [Rhizobium sp. VS19-DR181]